MLRRNCTDRVTPQEWEELLDCLHSGVRVLTLLPRDAAIAAVGVFGPSNPSTAVLKALGAAKPPEWDDAEEMSDDEEGDEDDPGEEEGDVEEDEERQPEDGAGDRSDGEEEDDDEEEEEEGEEDDEDEEEGGEEDEGGEESGEEREDGEMEEESDRGEEEVDDAAACLEQPKRARVAICDVPEQLERELAAYSRYRTETLNQHRGTAAVRSITVIGTPVLSRIHRVCAGPHVPSLVAAASRRCITIAIPCSASSVGLPT